MISNSMKLNNVQSLKGITYLCVPYTQTVVSFTAQVPLNTRRFQRLENDTIEEILGKITEIALSNTEITLPSGQLSRNFYDNSIVRSLGNSSQKKRSKKKKISAQSQEFQYRSRSEASNVLLTCSLRSMLVRFDILSPSVRFSLLVLILMKCKIASRSSVEKFVQGDQLL